MKVIMKFWIFSLLILSVLSSCSSDDDKSTLTVSIDGLQDLGSGYAYEGWIMVDGAPQTAGIFTVDADGKLSKNKFEIDADALSKATAYILTIEPSPDPNPAPSAVHLVAGDFSGNSATMSVGHGAALGSDLTSSTGGYILATPTDGANNNEASGVWFLDNSSGSPMAGLNLPSLPSGWRYEGWAVINGQPVSTGIFSSASGADESAAFSSSAGGPPFPGEDFLKNAPSGLTFPTDLRGSTIVVSVEPYPDNSPMPFVLKPLVGAVPASADVHSYITMDNKASDNNPSGKVSR